MRKEESGSTLTISGNPLTRYEDFGLYAYSGSGKVSGEIVDAGSALFLPGTAVDDYKGLDVTGKVVLIDLWVPGKWIRNDSTAMLVKPRARAELAFSRGAAGVIFYNPESQFGRSASDPDTPDTLPGPVLYVTMDVVKQIRSLPVAVAG